MVTAAIRLLLGPTGARPAQSADNEASAPEEQVGNGLGGIPTQAYQWSKFF